VAVVEKRPLVKVRLHNNSAFAGSLIPSNES